MKVTEAGIAARRRNALALNSGRPLGSIEETTAYKKAFHKRLAELIEENKTGLIRAMIKEALDGNVEAFKALLDRAQGKPAQAVELSGQNGNPIVFMPLELIQKHSLKVIEGQQTPQLEEPVKQGVDEATNTLPIV